MNNGHKSTRPKIQLDNKMLSKLGANLVNCELRCGGITNDPESGIIPRGLIHEPREGSNSCIVIGLNPGKCNIEERKYYLKHGIQYESLKKYFFDDSNLHDHPYFRKTRDLLNLLGFDGNILWTDIAKCECSGKNGTVPVQTFRVCIDRFLRQEIKQCVYSTIFALGKTAYNFCALSFPDRYVVGIPHPTGSRGHFIKLQHSVTAKLAFFKKCLEIRTDEHGLYRAIYLPEEATNLEKPHKLKARS